MRYVVSGDYINFLEKEGFNEDQIDFLVKQREEY